MKLQIYCLEPSFNLVVIFVAALSLSQTAYPQTELFKVTDSSDVLIPQFLLPCIHTEQVQAELKLTPSEVERVEGVLRSIDARWWPARNFEPTQQRTTVNELETELLKELEPILSPDKLIRLQAIELQAQGPRLMLRADVAARLGVSAETQRRFRELAEKAEKSLAEIQKKLVENPKQDYSEEVSKIRNEEVVEGYALLTDSQKQNLQTLLGKKLNFAEMQRVYPLAPELIDSLEWFGSSTRLSDLRGKVVLVHFYAFECINCRNNFGRYNEWVEKFKSQDVAIIGIQTPETSAESDPEKVRQAAMNDNFQFPVLIDIENKNCNAWGNTMWPTVYVVDKKGYIRTWWQGELNWQGATGDQKIVDVVNQLLKE